MSENNKNVETVASSTQAVFQTTRTAMETVQKKRSSSKEHSAFTSQTVQGVSSSSNNWIPFFNHWNTKKCFAVAAVHHRGARFPLESQLSTRARLLAVCQTWRMMFRTKETRDGIRLGIPSWSARMLYQRIALVRQLRRQSRRRQCDGRKVIIFERNHGDHVLEETDINENYSNATSTVNNDNDTGKDVSTMSYKDAVVNKGWFACQIILYDLLGRIEKLKWIFEYRTRRRDPRLLWSTPYRSP